MRHEAMIMTEPAYRQAQQRLHRVRADLPAVLADEPPYAESRARALWEKLIAHIENDIAFLEMEILQYEQNRSKYRWLHAFIHFQDEWPGWWFLITTISLLLVYNVSFLSGTAVYAAGNAILCGASIIVYDLATSGKYWSPLSAVLPLIVIGAGAYLLIHT